MTTTNTTKTTKATAVTIGECKNDGRRWHAECKTSDKWEAIARAVRAHFGPGAFFWHDTGIKGEVRVYGQIMRKIGIAQNTSVTGRVWIYAE